MQITLNGDTHELAGPLTVTVPQLNSVDVRAVALSALAFALLFLLHRGIITTLAICGTLAIAWFLAAGG